MTPGRKVAVIGIGAVGSMAMWALAKRGVTDLHGFDAYAPGHDRGGYGGQSRIFRLAYREGAEYVPLLLRARELWRELEEISGQHLLTETGGLTIAPEGHQDLKMVQDSIRQFDLPHENLTPQEVARRFPQLPLSDGEVAVLDHSAGVLRPERSVIAASQAAESLGATIHRYTPVSMVKATGDKVTVVSELGEYTFDHVVLAPGPWAREFLDLSSVPLEAHQISTMWFLARNPSRFALDRSPIVIRSGPIAFSSFPSVDGETVKVSLHSLPRPLVNSAEKIDRNPSKRLTTAMREAVQTYLPDLNPDPVRIGTYADCFTHDHHGIIGTLPALPNTTVMTGFSGHGFKLAPTLGEIAADLALTDETAHPIHHLAPSRFSGGEEQ